MRAQEFERLFEEHAEPLLAFLVYRTGNRPLAEDIVADTFERVIRARRRFDPRKASDAIALRYGADMTVPEIAKLTREKLTTVEGRVYRALRKLREALE